MATNVSDFSVHRSIRNLRKRIEALDDHINKVKILWGEAPEEAKSDSVVISKFVEALIKAVRAKKQANEYIKILQRGLDADARA